MPQQRRAVIVAPPIVSHDDQVRDAVIAALEGDPPIDMSQTDVQVNDGVVELAGALPHPYLRTAAIMRAERVRGVRAVIDRFEPILAEPRTDEEIQRDVQTALSIDTFTEGLTFEVAVDRGEVTLRGSARSFGQRRVAERIARAVRGVRRVESAIRMTAPARSTAQIAGDVRTAIRNDRWVDPWTIDVVVRGDVVELHGTQPTAAAKRRAIEVALVAGVRDVDASDLRVDPEIPDRERVAPRDFAPPTESEIQAAVYLALDRDAAMIDPIEVRFENGILTLTGEVSSIAARDAAHAAASQVRGIDRVITWIVVDRDPIHTNYRMRQAALRALSLAPEVDASRISVAIDHGACVLRGSLDTARARSAATEACQRVSGVIGVRNEIAVPEREARISDAELRERIVTRLEWNPYLDDRRVEVEVIDGRALLRGDVDDPRGRDEAVRLAREAGARGVLDGTLLAMR
jgi:osmotically-inducible protein OsmY